MAERGDKVLDAYVGNGLMLEYLQRNMECEVCGVSDDMQCVRTSRSRLRNADIVYASREDIPWKEDTFDSVYLKIVTSSPTEAALEEILRVLKPGGQLLIGFRTIPAPFRQVASLLRADADDELHKPKTRGPNADNDAQAWVDADHLATDRSAPQCGHSMEAHGTRRIGRNNE